MRVRQILRWIVDGERSQNLASTSAIEINTRWKVGFDCAGLSTALYLHPEEARHVADALHRAADAAEQFEKAKNPVSSRSTIVNALRAAA